MKFDSNASTTVVFQEDIALSKFLQNLTDGYSKIKNDHIIVNFFSFSKLTSDDMLEFLELSNTHRKANKSFVLVTDKVSFDKVPKALIVVPTIREAHDIIEMEDIERDLGI